MFDMLTDLNETRRKALASKHAVITNHTSAYCAAQTDSSDEGHLARKSPTQSPHVRCATVTCLRVDVLGVHQLVGQHQLRLRAAHVSQPLAPWVESDPFHWDACVRSQQQSQRNKQR